MSSICDEIIEKLESGAFGEFADGCSPTIPFEYIEQLSVVDYASLLLALEEVMCEDDAFIEGSFRVGYISDEEAAIAREQVGQFCDMTNHVGGVYIYGELE